MEKLTKREIKEIESQPTEELKDKLTDDLSGESVKEALRNVLSGLMKDNYYLETSPDGTSVTVKNRANNKLIYYTDMPSEVTTLKKVDVRH